MYKYNASLIISEQHEFDAELTFKNPVNKGDHITFEDVDFLVFNVRHEHDGDSVIECDSTQVVTKEFNHERLN